MARSKQMAKSYEKIMNIYKNLKCSGLIHYSFIIFSLFIIPKGFHTIIYYSKSILDRYSLFIIHLQPPIVKISRYFPLSLYD